MSTEPQTQLGKCKEAARQLETDKTRSDLRNGWETDEASAHAGEARVRLAMLAALVLTGCGEATSPTYTLYRSSPLDPAMRVHWASFDAADKGAGPDKGGYNRGNCEMTVDLLRANLRNLNAGQEPVRFWCEQGSFKP